MSLALDTVFVAALKADETITEIIGDRIWSIAAQMPEEAFLSNVDVPYLIVNFDGFSSEFGTKDDPFDSGEDTVNMSVTVAAENSEQLASLAAQVRRAIHDYLVAHDGEDGIPSSTVPGGGQKFYDELKPCFGIDLTWQCVVSFDLTPDDDEQAEAEEGAADDNG